MEAIKTLPGTIFDLPLIRPLLALLQSRKFLAAVMTLVVDMIIAQAPQLEPVRNELLTVFTLIGITMIGSIAHEDAAKQQQQGGVTFNTERSGTINVSTPAAAATTSAPDAPPAISPVGTGAIAPGVTVQPSVDGILLSQYDTDDLRRLMDRVVTEITDRGTPPVFDPKELDPVG